MASGTRETLRVTSVVAPVVSRCGPSRMLNENCLVCNVRGLNPRSRRNVSLLSLQETKLDVCSDLIAWFWNSVVLVLTTFIRAAFEN